MAGIIKETKHGALAAAPHDNVAVRGLMTNIEYEVGRRLQASGAQLPPLAPARGVFAAKNKKCRHA